MTQTIEDRHSQGDAAPGQRPEAPKVQTVRPAVLAVIVIAIVIAAVLVIRSATDEAPATKPTVMTGTTMSIVMRCGAVDQGCIAGTTAPDGNQWVWATSVHEAVPEQWLGREIAGKIQIDSEWGSSTFIAADQSIVVQGGKATPGHSLFG
jgi:hypothetical protein